MISLTGNPGLQEPLTQSSPSRAEGDTHTAGRAGFGIDVLLLLHLTINQWENNWRRVDLIESENAGRKTEPDLVTWPQLAGVNDCYVMPLQPGAQLGAWLFFKALFVRQWSLFNQSARSTNRRVTLTKT